MLPTGRELNLRQSWNALCSQMAPALGGSCDGRGCQGELHHGSGQCPALTGLGMAWAARELSVPLCQAGNRNFSSAESGWRLSLSGLPPPLVPLFLLSTLTSIMSTWLTTEALRIVFFINSGLRKKRPVKGESCWQPLLWAVHKLPPGKSLAAFTG